MAKALGGKPWGGDRKRKQKQKERDKGKKKKKERKKEDKRTPVLLVNNRMGTVLRDRNLRQASLMVANY